MSQKLNEFSPRDDESQTRRNQRLNHAHDNGPTYAEKLSSQNGPKMHTEQRGGAGFQKAKRNQNFPSHRCSVNHDVDLVKLLVPADTVHRRVEHWWRRLCLIDPQSTLTRQIFRSDAAIKREISRHLTYFRYSIHPLSRFRFIWECLMIVTFALAFQMIPYDVMLLFRAGDYYPFTSFHAILLAIDVVCLLDIGMSFFTGMYVQRTQRVELNLKNIRKEYLHLWFWIDVVSSAPDPMITRLIPSSTLDNSLLYCLHKLDFHPGCAWDFWSLISVLKIFRFRTFLRYIRRLCQRLGLRRNVTKFTTIMTTVLTVFHWGTCILFLVIRLVQGTDPALVDPRSWTHTIPFWNQSSFVQYLECSYRTLYTVTHITHDFSESVTYDDMMVSLIYTICGYILKIYLLAELFIFIRILFSSTSKYHENRYELGNYMRHEQLPAALQQQILQFYDIRHPKHYSRPTFIRATVGEQLFGEGRMEIVGPLLRSCPLFRETMTEEQLTELAVAMCFQLFLRNDIITRWENDGAGGVGGRTTNWNIIFIVSGTVAVYTSGWKEVLQLEDGEHFGELQLIFGEDMVVTREAFDAFLHPYPTLRKNLVALAAEQLRQMGQMTGSGARERLANVETVRMQTKMAD
ncbi:AGAP005463-PA-like protein [Anopheles sinensis]|uniref:AGAP005463-PA-like protein n=1 Tax=Anopheles sinensis TaxID=74873 RepID=A0A084W2U8_ANOSI|nr:AGAP005463-PA-like protein [Anopheles sinensis]